MENQLPELSENQLPPLTVKEIQNETLKFFNLEKGLAFTYVSLLKNPFNTINGYLRINRRKVSNPLQYILFGVAVYTLILQFHPSFHAFMTKLYTGSNMATIQKQATLFEAFKKAQAAFFSYQNVFFLIVIPVVSLVTFWIFRKLYNYAENLVIHAFAFGTSMWTSVILGTLTLFIKSSLIMFPILPLVSYLLISYLYKSIYQLDWLKAIGTMLLVYGIMMVFATIFQIALALYFLFT